MTGPEHDDEYFELPQWMREAAQREMENPTPAGPPDDPAEITARIRALRDELHAQARDEYLRDLRRLAEELGPDELDDDQDDADRWEEQR